MTDEQEKRENTEAGKQYSEAGKKHTEAEELYAEAEKQHNEAGEQYAEAGKRYTDTTEASKQAGVKRREEAEQRQADEEAEQQRPAVDEAAARFAETLAESYRIVHEQAANARDRQGKLAKDFSERVMDHLREQSESGLAASERLADQSRRQREAGQAFAQESAKAYMDFLNTAFSQYREGTQRAAGSAQEGARAVSESVAGLLGTATGAAGATASVAADATRTSAESAAGRPPFSDYDEMNVEEITEQLDGLSEAKLRRTRNYEQGNKNRETLVAQIDRRLEASS